MPSSDRRPAWMVPADEAILRDLDEQRLDYPPLVASRCGLHVPFVERRCRTLTDRGLLEQATSESTFRVTRRGKRFLEGDGALERHDSRPDASPRA